MVVETDLSIAVSEVQAFCPDASASDIRIDLMVSGSTEATINRFFDGLFLVVRSNLYPSSLIGTACDPSLELKKTPPSKINNTNNNKNDNAAHGSDDVIIIESDDDLSILPLPRANHNQKQPVFLTKSSSYMPPYASAQKPPPSLFAHAEINESLLLSSSDSESSQNPTTKKSKSKQIEKTDSTNFWQNEYDEDESDFAELTAVPKSTATKGSKISRVAGATPSVFTASWLDDYTPENDFSDTESTLKKHASIEGKKPAAKRCIGKSIFDESKTTTNLQPPSKKTKTGESFLTQHMSMKYNLHSIQLLNTENSDNDCSNGDDDNDGSSDSSIGQRLKKLVSQPGAAVKKKTAKVSAKSLKYHADSESSGELPHIFRSKSSNQKQVGIVNKKEKERAKGIIAAEKERLKEEKAEAKRLERDAKIHEKELKKQAKEEEKKFKTISKEANKIRTKLDVVTDMTLLLNPDFISIYPGAARIISSAQEIGAKIKLDSTATTSTSFSNVIQWTRAVSRIWDPIREVWNQCELREEVEPHILVMFQATDLSKLILAGGDNGSSSCVQKYIEEIKQRYGAHKKIVVFVEGMKDLLKERNRMIDGQVRGRVRTMGGAMTAPTTSRAKPLAGGNGLSAAKSDFDSAFLWLQMCGGCFLQLSENLEESCNLVASFTTSIAMIPERRARSEQQLRLNFGDTVKSGESLQDVWRRVLMEVKPCTETVANTVIEVYPTYRHLMEAYRKLPSQEAREKLLENLDVKRVTSTKRIGPSISRKICLALTSENARLQVFDPPPPKKIYTAASAGTSGVGGRGGGPNPFSAAAQAFRGGRGGFGRGRGGF
ncbi:putative monocarboxylate transporter mch1 [Physocladia obscura]|uniref:Monocarboxylate transporter mch1 n=1 Tax=Physocladia obscura TaxID=109957 RepID=A0AAD5T5X7_9FUNG|nr:putative monocarboxylate transporter mch1 [Physocladia obscura]